ncbi:hypothetical protein ABKN59_008091 [Abortiporus biennis]
MLKLWHKYFLSIRREPKASPSKSRIGVVVSEHYYFQSLQIMDNSITYVFMHTSRPPTRPRTFPLNQKFVGLLPSLTYRRCTPISSQQNLDDCSRITLSTFYRIHCEDIDSDATRILWLVSGR